MTTSAVGIGTGSCRREGGGVLATPVSGFVHDEASSDSRTDECTAGPSALRIASAKSMEMNRESGLFRKRGFSDFSLTRKIPILTRPLGTGLWTILWG